MDEETRKRVDAACLRLMGYKQNDALPSLWFGPYDSVSVGKDGPSQDSRHVVPLAEALRARGLDVEIRNGDGHGWFAEVGPPNDLSMRVQEFAATLPEALALAAARAVVEK